MQDFLGLKMHITMTDYEYIFVSLQTNKGFEI